MLFIYVDRQTRRLLVVAFVLWMLWQLVRVTPPAPDAVSRPVGAHEKIQNAPHVVVDNRKDTG